MTPPPVPPPPSTTKMSPFGATARPPGSMKLPARGDCGLGAGHGIYTENAATAGRGTRAAKGTRVDHEEVAVGLERNAPGAHEVPARGAVIWVPVTGSTRMTPPLPPKALLSLTRMSPGLRDTAARSPGPTRERRRTTVARTSQLVERFVNSLQVSALQADFSGPSHAWLSSNLALKAVRSARAVSWAVPHPRSLQRLVGYLGGDHNARA